MLLLQGYLEPTVSKCTCMCFAFSDLDRDREGERGEDWDDKESFLKNIFFHCQLAKAFNVLRTLELQSIWAKKKLVLNCLCVIQQRWSASSSLILNFTCLYDWLQQCIIISLLFSFLTSKTKAVSSSRTLIRTTTRVACSRHILSTYFVDST